jgi:DNA-binding NarL/FixJ family response regulator
VNVVLASRPVVLLVEEDSALRRLMAIGLRVFLDDLGVEVRETNDGDAAVRWVAAVRPAAVVADVLMPGAGGGAGIVARLKAAAGPAGVPVVGIGGDPDALDRATAAGADAVLPTSLGPRAVAAQLRVWLEGVPVGV